MATPYFQVRLDSVGSTQDVAREELGDLPVLVMAPRQTRGRGRSGAVWESADRALAASLALRPGPEDQRPFSLMAGVAAVRALPGAGLKWPNDVIGEGAKVGGILVERSSDVVVVGFGLNLWWPSAPEGAGAIYDEDPGPERHLEIGGLWGAELMRLFDADDWPRDEYREACLTLGRKVSWDPDGEGKAVDIATDGGLVVERGGRRETLHSGAVSHLRP